MDKRLRKLAKDIQASGVFFLLGGTSSLVIGVLLFYFVGMPLLRQVNDLKEKNAQADQVLETIRNNVAAVSSVDALEVAELDVVTSKLLPSSSDHVRVAALLDVIALASGGRITNIQATDTSSPRSNPSTPVTLTQGSGTGTSSYTMTVNFEGTFPSLLKFLTSLRWADRVFGVADLTAAGSQNGTNLVQVKLSLKLPLTLTQTQELSPQQEVLLLSKNDADEIKALQKNILFRVKPASQPLSRTNPFASY
ncbi:MAG: hypothetical protein Q8P13_01790 [bacterium]|nr:hypothetical protein [bacterium]